MKKFITTLAILAVAAGSAFAQVSVGGGYLNSTKTQGNVKANAEGFYAGIGYNYTLAQGLTLSPGLYYSNLTSKDANSVSIWGINASSEITEKEHYLTLPVNLNYGLTLVPGALRLFVYGGPSLQYCLSSKTTTSGQIAGWGGTSEHDNLKADGSTYTPFDVLIGGGVGVDISNMIRVNAGYNYGILDRDSSDNTVLHRAGWHLGVSFLF